MIDNIDNFADGGVNFSRSPAFFLLFVVFVIFLPEEYFQFPVSVSCIGSSICPGGGRGDVDP